MRLGLFNTRGINYPNFSEHFIKLELDELRKQGHEVEMYWLKGRHPTKEEVQDMEFAIMHFVPTSIFFMRIGVPFCVLPTASDIFIDEGRNLKLVEQHPKCVFVGYQSQFHKKCYEEWGIQKPIVHIPHCVRTKLFTRERKYNPYGYYIAGGRLIPKKGIDRILKHKAGLRVFGDGPLKEYLESFYPNNRYMGFLNGRELKNLFEKASIYFYPAIVTPEGDQDGLPNSIKEALLMNLQCIAFPISGIPEFEGVYLLDNWNREGIEKAISEIPKRPNAEGEAYIRENFSPKVCVEKLLNAIKEFKK